MPLFGKRKAQDRILDAGKVTYDESRLAHVLLMLIVDTSLSMQGTPIQQVNLALKETADWLHDHVTLSSSAYVAVVEFGRLGVRALRGPRPARAGESPFVVAHEWTPPELQEGGVTPLVEAVELAVRCVEEKKAELKARNVSYYRPICHVMTDGRPTDRDGNPTDDWKRLVPKLRQAEEDRRMVFFAMQTPGIDPEGEEALEALAPQRVFTLNNFDKDAVFALFSASVTSASEPDFEKYINDVRQVVAPYS